MTHWLLEKIEEQRTSAIAAANRAEVLKEIQGIHTNVDEPLLARSAEILELAVLDLCSTNDWMTGEHLAEIRSAAADAFRLLRARSRPQSPVYQAAFLLRAGALAVIGDKGADAARWLKQHPWDVLPLNSDDWRERTIATVYDVWLRLIRKDGWNDRDLVLERIASLRESQQQFERGYLDALDGLAAKSSALEMIGFYHLAKAAEIFAVYVTDGVVEGRHQIQQLLSSQFDRVFAICTQAKLIEFESLARLLAITASQMAENSIWTVTRAVNSRVTRFVRTLVDRGRGAKSIFDVLPPQRRTLAERGLLGSGRRAVVVSLPTSSGKTLIAEFRMLQALNQFDRERGWVAYLAPTRTLVNQITRQLRRDFEQLGVVVEQVSPALEVDSIEAGLLLDAARETEFRILVTTPEKLDLMLRQGWEEKIGRPLTLVIVDEAHNIQDENRGLKLELLLATINSECQFAQFLLLTPFISNGREVARWLGGANSEDVSLSLDWQPNDRLIGIVSPEKGAPIGRQSFGYSLNLQPVHTTRKTLFVDELLALPGNDSIANTYRKVCDQSSLAAVTAQSLHSRGPIIVMHSRPDWVWTLADKFRIEENLQESTENIRLVQDYLRLEMGENFPLIALLSYGVGVHHSGLSDEVRALMEWLFEEEELKFLVATTTIAQGVNFPVTGVVMASHQYPYGVDMPPEDFWNIAGRAGRVSQGQMGVVTLVADSENKANALNAFVRKQTGELNSALLKMAISAGENLGDLHGIIYNHPEWSSFVQYLAHTYRQMEEPEGFADEVEQVLRNTFGFEKLRERHPQLAAKLLEGVGTYSEYLQTPGQPLKLVDSTGFSLQSIKRILNDLGQFGIDADSWNEDLIFSNRDDNLQSMMGVLLRVPELRENLTAVTGGAGPDGDKLALILKDWVNGASIPDIAMAHFGNDEGDEFKALAECSKNLFGRLTQTAAWGLGALLSITGGDLEEEEFQSLINLPSRAFYGVNNDNAVVLRLLGVSRSAATRLARDMGNIVNEPISNVRARLRQMDSAAWQRSLGNNEGQVYRKVWRVLEGLD